MLAFIDDFRVIRIEDAGYITQIHLPGYNLQWVKNENNNQFFETDRDLELHLVDTIWVDNEKLALQIGLVTLKETFDQRFRYEGPLGAVCTKKQTDFYLFTPVAKAVFVVVGGKSYPMTYKMPVWHLSLPGDYHLEKYHFQVRLVDALDEVDDPYAKIIYQQKGIIVDLNRVPKLEPSPIMLKNNVDAVIYEGHVRDLTRFLDVSDPGLFDGLIARSEKLEGTVLEYIKNLGMTHLQLLPILAFYGVDEINKDSHYNWGYNPAHYFALEGWFIKNNNNPLEKITAFQNVVKHAHSIGLGINLDVVYNHVFTRKTFAYDKIIPGYFYRHDKNNQLTESCGCGPDVETRRFMVRRMIVDSLVFLAEVYRVDGFRFDLMGLMDIETMRLIEKKLKSINPNVMLYGEGWMMDSVMRLEERATMANQNNFPMYAHFNDYFRNTMRGETNQKGYAMGNIQLINQAMEALVGSPKGYQSLNQTINYVECHDDMTYFDKLMSVSHHSLQENHQLQDFVNHLVAIALGIPFYHAGQELYRSKQGVANSYQDSDHINGIRWHSYPTSVDRLQVILAIRKQFSMYRQVTNENKTLTQKHGSLIIYQLEDEQHQLTHYLKTDFKPETWALPEGDLLF
ncbi:MAG: alpha-amylase family glycosyl hydrolase, partial [Acholeplasmataceae bacterium]|nr:alpha-amylase family glycosyl hydrolase [Acholeplasmataceae bacterium]